MNEKVLPGQALSHRDARGGIYILRIASADEEPGIAGEGTTVNAYFTHKGHKRSGDLHKVAQYDVLLTGRARLKVLNPKNGTEEIIDLRPNELVKIPPYRPHVFEFLEDTSMLEWWDGQFEAFYYAQYRKEIGEATTRLLSGS
jgi:oxalate decarboxylase/phosphoglucose isomerase-like protein (cupin superfamily)